MNELDRINSFILQVKRELLLENDILLKLLDIDSLGRQVNMKGLSNLAEYLNLSLENIFEGDIDYGVIRRNFISPSRGLPSKYLSLNGTYMESIRGISNYVTAKTNEKTSMLMLNSFQINQCVLLNDDIMLNNTLTNDLFEYMHNVLNFKLEDMYFFALFTFDFEKRKVLKNLFKKCVTDFDIVSIVAEHGNSFEQNFTYSISQLGSGYFSLKSISTEFVNNELKKTWIASELTLAYKEKIIYAMNNLAQRNPLQLISIENTAIKSRQHVNFIYKETAIHS